MIDLSNVSNKTLVEFYNQNADAPVKKFRDTATAQARVLRLIEEKGLTVVVRTMGEDSFIILQDDAAAAQARQENMAKDAAAEQALEETATDPVGYKGYTAKAEATGVTILKDGVEVDSAPTIEAAFTRIDQLVEIKSQEAEAGQDSGDIVPQKSDDLPDNFQEVKGQTRDDTKQAKVLAALRLGVTIHELVLSLDCSKAAAASLIQDLRNKGAKITKGKVENRQGWVYTISE